ncbi:MAG: cysteine desulfurase [archaeon]|nr:cysteine desulfurase [archaeon]
MRNYIIDIEHGTDMDVASVRKDFPTIRKGKGIYLDSACQSLKPDSVIEKITEYYSEYPACGGRSVHSMGTCVSAGVDETREKLSSFFGCDDPCEFVFMKNTTEGMNTIARGFGLKKDDIVVTTDVEHNSNHAQWLAMASEVGIRRKYIKSSKYGEFDIDLFKQQMSSRVKLVAVGHTSNVTGYTIPLKEITEIAHDYGAAVAVDGAQSAPHMSINLKKLDVDFFCASLHKMLGPTGVGFMYGKSERLKDLKPLIYGGGSVAITTYDSIKISSAPEKFESGLENYSGIIASAFALDYLLKIGMKNITKHESKLQRRIHEGVKNIENLSIVGSNDPDKRGSVFSFNVEGLNSHDIAMMLDNIGSIMIRSGMHCAHPFFISRGIDGCARASFYLYNNEDDIDKFVETLDKIVTKFSK